MRACLTYQGFDGQIVEHVALVVAQTARRMRRMRIFGNELAVATVVSTVTPGNSSSASNSAFLAAEEAAARPRHGRNAVISRGRHLKPGADLTMKEQIGGNQKRARFQAL